MNKNIMTAYEKFEKVFEKTSNDYQWENIEHEMLPAMSYDDKHGNSENYAIPLERVESDLEELTAIVMNFYYNIRESNDFQSYNDFVTFFAAYCNFYIKKGLVCRLKDTENRMFGLEKENFVDDNFKELFPYMEEIFQGIFTQDYTCFGKATNIIPEFSVAHLYLFVFYTTYYYYYKQELKKSPENENFHHEIEQFETLMEKEYFALPPEYQEYAWGTGEYYRGNLNPAMDENILPYISTDTNYDIFRKNLETHCRAFINKIFSSDESETSNKSLLIRLYLTFIKKTLDNIDNPKYQDMIPLQQNVEDWTVLPPAGRYALLHICNKVFVNAKYEADPFRELFHYGIEKKALAEELKYTNKKLEFANESKIEIFNKFSHDYKHIQAETLQDMAHSLLQMDEPILKEYGGRILLEYGSKTDLVKKLKMMQLQFKDDDDALRQLIHESVGKKRINNIVTIDDMLCIALRRCLLSLIYSQHKNDDGTKTNIWDFCFPDKNIDELRELAEKTVVFSGDNEIIKNWYKEHLFPLEVFPYSDAWKRVCLKSNDYGAIVITNLLTELFYNIFRYADKNSKVSFYFSDTPDILEIKLINTIAEVDRSKIDSTNLGLSSKESLIAVLSRTRQPIEHHAIAPENTQYLTKVSLDRTLFFKK